MDDEQRKRIDEAAQESLKRIKASAIMLSMVTENYLKDPLCAIQLGYAVLLDKPILLLVQSGTKLPMNLLRAAKKIEYADIADVDSMDRAMRSLCDFANQNLPEGARP